MNKGTKIMKRLVTKGFVTAGLLVAMTLIAGVAAQAQSLQYKLTANIPFDFTVADKKVPAGKYSVSRAREITGDTLLQVTSADGQVTVNRFSIPVVTFNPKSRGSFVFHRYGDQYFLSQVWPAGGSTGRAFPKTHAERELERSARENQVGAVNAPKADVGTVVITVQ
jgi:hypothetical protein